MLYEFPAFGKPLPAPGFFLMATSPGVADLLAGALAEHSLIFERRGRLLEMVGPHEPTRVIDFLRLELPEAARAEVRVVAAVTSGFSASWSLDEWWRTAETGWFEDAFTRTRFSTLFQPVVDTRCNRIFGHECLIHLQGARVYSGAEIVDAARVRNHLRKFDSHARCLAVQSAAERGGPGIFFVNLLADSVFRPDRCLEATFAVVAASGLPPSRLIFEVVRAEHAERTHLLALAEAIRSRGCGFGLDDAGPDAARLIAEVRPDYIKLAPHLLTDIEAPSCASAIHRLVAVSDRAGAIAIAKNVESPRTMENLWLLGVQHMQGYFFGRPSSTPTPQPTDLLNLASALEPDYVLVRSRRN